MADITRDDIFDKDLAQPLRELNEEFAKTLEMLKKTTLEADKTNASLKIGSSDEAAASTRKLAEEQKKLIAAQKEQQKAADALQKQRQKALEQIAKLEQQQRELVEAANMEAKTYEQLSQKMSALNKLRKQQDLSTQEGRAAYQSMTKQVMDLNKQLMAMDAEVGTHNRNVGNYKSVLDAANMSMGEMKRALRELRNIPLAGKTPEEIAQVEKQIASLTDELGDYQARMRSSGDSVQVMIEGLQGVVAVAQGVTAGLSAMGYNTEKLDKAMVQLIGVSQALATIHQLQEKQTLKVVAAIIKDTYAKVANTIATKGMTLATEGATVATRALGTAMKSIPFVAIAAAAVTLISAIVMVAVKMNEATTEEKLMREAIEKSSEEIGKQRGELDKYLVIAKDTKRSYEERQKAIEEINKISPEYLGNLNIENINTQAATSSINQYNAAIGRRAKMTALENILIEKYTELEKTKGLQRRIEIENEIAATEKLISNLNEMSDGKLFNRIDSKGGDEYYEGKEMMDYLTGTVYVYKNGNWVKKTEVPKANNGAGGVVNSEKTALDELNKSLKDNNEQYRLKLELLKNEIDPQKQAIELMSAEIDNVTGIYNAYKKYYEQDSQFSASELESLKRIDGKVNGLEREKKALEDLYATYKSQAAAAGENNPFEGFTPRPENIAPAAGGNTFSDYLGQLNDELTKFWSDYGENIKTIYSSIDTIIQNSFDRQSQLLDEQQKQSDEYYANKMKAYDGDEAAQDELAAKQLQDNKRIEREKIRLARKEAVYERSKALFEIGIATATAIIKQLGATPLPYGAPFLAAVIAAGIAQTAAVISKPLPQYYTGLDDAKTDHLASIAERGRELMQLPDGTLKLYEEKQPVFVPKHSKIYDNAETEALLNSLIISSMNGIKSGTKTDYDFDKLDKRLAAIDLTIKRKPVPKLKIGYSLRDIDYIKRYDV
jgi:hypothetical protein